MSMGNILIRNSRSEKGGLTKAVSLYRHLNSDLKHKMGAHQT